MAEGFGSYHVPQQSRRDKLRVVAQNHPNGGCVDSSAAAANLQGFFPLYDPSFLSSDLLTCNNTSCGGHAAVKQEFANMMGFVGAPTAASSSPYFDPPQSSTFAAANPSSSTYQGFDTNNNNNNNNNPLVYSPQNIQNLRDFTHSYNSGELIVFKPETPLSLVNNKESNAAAAATTTVQGGLSLSLSSHYGQSHYGHHQSNNLPLELNLQRYGSSSSSVYGDKDADHEGFVVPQQVPGCASMSNDMSRSLVPLGPFTGYASVLKESRFLKPAQQLLEEFCNVGGKVDSCTLMDRPLMQSFTASEFGDNSHSSGDGVGQPKKSRLLLMLEEVYRRYKQYYQQMQAALASFEYVPGLGNAAPYAHMALKTMCKHFTSLKNALTDQLQFTSKADGGCMSHRKDEDPTYGNTNKSIHGQRFIEQQPVWRPQRGLPERAVTVLRAWLFEHFLHPYPTDTDKLMLAKQTGLSRNQVSNWFINARVRLWKPMVEEIHMLESRQAQKAARGEEQNSSRRNDNLFSGKTLSSENLSTSDRRKHGIPSTHTRNELPDVHVGNEGQLNLSYNISNHAQGNANANITGGASGVSLTLGLHQNNVIGLSEPFPVNAPQRFGTNLDPEASHGFGLQNQHIGGQLLHDFVG